MADCRALAVRALSAFAVLIMIASAYVAVPAKAAGTWSTPVMLSSSDRIYTGTELQVGQNYMYVLTHEYGSSYGHPLFLYRSGDGGATWIESMPLTDVFRGEAGMVVYPDGGNDTVLIATNGMILKSEDNGTSFTTISYLPLPDGGLWWRFMDIGTLSSNMYGSIQDDQVFVAGSVAMGTPWMGGQYKVFFTRSTDGGMTWTDPVLVCDTPYESYQPKLIYDGTTLYCTYQHMPDGFPYADVAVSMSSDLGATWSEPKVVIARGPNTVVLWLHGVQYLDSTKALVTVGDYGWAGINDRPSVGRYGFFNFADQTYTEVGTFEGPDWNVQCGLSGQILADNTFGIAWLKGTPASSSIRQVMYAVGTGTGLDSPPYPPIARFTTTKNWGEVSFDASASSDRNDPPLALNYAWDFGDGYTALGVTTNHKYIANGTYLVTLTVTNTIPLSTSTEKAITVTISPPPPPPPPPITYFFLELHQGWNMVSVPVSATGYKASTLGLASHEVVTAFNPMTQVYDKTFVVGVSPPTSDFEIAPSTGYWVYAIAPETLSLPGITPTGNQTRNVAVPNGGGWFMLGFESLNTTRHASEIPGMYSSAGTILMVAAMDPVTKSYVVWLSVVPGLNNFALEPGRGYWCFCTAGGTISYIS